MGQADGGVRSGKILLDLAVSRAIGDDCVADIAQLRFEPTVFGHVVFDPTVSRLNDTLAADGAAELKGDQYRAGGGRARRGSRHAQERSGMRQRDTGPL